MRYFLSIAFVCFFPLLLKAQILVGSVEEYKTLTPLQNVQIININNEKQTTSNAGGSFTLAGNAGDLIEFRLEGYKTQRVRIPALVPKFFRIEMTRVVPQFVAHNGPTGDYHNDSLRYGLLYAKQLGFARFTTLDKIQHPFSALSKYNRDLWKFQDNYKWFEQLKYVDYTFSDKTLKELTGLPADSAAAYRRRYAIPYEHLRSMKKYDVFLYIKQTVNQFRINNGRSPIRLSN